jgi:hypothetical protein
MVEKLAEELLTYRADAKRGKGDCTGKRPHGNRRPVVSQAN